MHQIWVTSGEAVTRPECFRADVEWTQASENDLAMHRTTISNVELTLKDVPLSNAEWRAIVPFAHTFNGYEEAGSFAAAGELANRYRDSVSKDRTPLTLTQLRICLFFEQRRWNHAGREPDGENLQYIHFLIEDIRTRVEAGAIW